MRAKEMEGAQTKAGFDTCQIIDFEYVFDPCTRLHACMGVCVCERVTFQAHLLALLGHKSMRRAVVFTLRLMQSCAEAAHYRWGVNQQEASAPTSGVMWTRRLLNMIDNTPLHTHTQMSSCSKLLLLLSYLFSFVCALYSRYCCDCTVLPYVALLCGIATPQAPLLVSPLWWPNVGSVRAVSCIYMVLSVATELWTCCVTAPIPIALT